MKHHWFLPFAAIAILAHSCKPIVIVTAPTPKPGLSDSAECVVLGKSDTTRIMERPIGELSYELSCEGIHYWTYAHEQNLKLTALRAGANVIKIEDYTRPGKHSAGKVNARLYRVSKLQHYERVIEWSEHRKLTKADFRGAPDAREKSGTVCEFAFPPGFRVFGNDVVGTGARFYCQSSWINGPARDSAALLLHEQGNFDLCELYRRQLEQSLRPYAKKAFPRQKAEINILREVCTCYVAKRAQYEAETDRGMVESRQSGWTKRIARQLERKDGTIDPLFELDHIVTRRQRDSVAKSLRPPPDKALVYVIRPRTSSTPLGMRFIYNPFLICAPYLLIFDVNQYTVDLDGAVVGPLHGHSYAYKFFEPRCCKIGVVMNRDAQQGMFGKSRSKEGNSIDLTLESGKVYCLQLTTGSTWFAPSPPALHLLTEPEGKRLLDRCMLMNDDDSFEFDLYGRPFYE
jgi:hypothetical protein